eukprot:scaffold27183_cov354-Skeletonema_menzelii.AAC.1
MEADDASGPADANHHMDNRKNKGGSAAHPPSSGGTNNPTSDIDDAPSTEAVEKIFNNALKKARSVVEAESMELHFNQHIISAITTEVMAFLTESVKGIKQLMTLEKFSHRPDYKPRSVPSPSMHLHTKGDTELAKTKEFKSLETQLVVAANQYQKTCTEAVLQCNKLIMKKHTEKILRSLSCALNRAA